MVTEGVRVADIKNKPVGFLLGRLAGARAAGLNCVDVLNRGRPILHIGLAQDLPEKWRIPEPTTVPLIDFKRSRASLVAIRREGSAVLLTQRSGPTLAVWPLDKAYSRPPEQSVVERMDYLERQLKTLIKRVNKFETIISRLNKGISDLNQSVNQPL